jgi:hypothetical protein
VARVELARAAVEDLEGLTRTHSLPADTHARVARSLRGLERFPLMGPALSGRWEGLRFLLGPWRWLLLVYVFIESEDRVVVVTIQDARSSAASATLAEEAAADARFYVNPHVVSVTCPPGKFTAGSQLLCRANLWLGHSHTRSEPLSVSVSREEGEIYATVTARARVK